MDDGWFYAEEGKSIGPVTRDALVTLLRKIPDPGKVKVWHTGFADWQDAKGVPQISDQIFRPPPLSNGKLERTPMCLEEAQPSEQDAAKRVQKNTRGRVSFLIALVILLVLGAFLSSIIYGNSAEGIGFLAGEFIGAAFILYLISWPWRRSTYRNAIVVLVAALSVGLSNGQKILDGIAAREGRTALQNARTPEQIEKALEQNPSNPLLQLIAEANKAAQETVRLGEKLSNEIEPPSLTQDLDFARVGRADLEAYYRDLKAAEANATAAMPRYLALLNDERNRVESFAQTLSIDKGVVRDLLNGVDMRHERSTAFTSKMLTARAELYRALGSSVAILIEQFGKYKVDANGRFLFSSQSIADQFNDAFGQVTAATNRVAQLEEERKKLIQFQQEGWERFISGK
jgi:GYF domain 2